MVAGSDCTNGGLRHCKAFWSIGCVRPWILYEDALSDAEAAEGYVLCWPGKGEERHGIDVLASSGAVQSETQRTQWPEIVRSRPLRAHRIRLSAKPLEGALPMFLPGQ